MNRIKEESSDEEYPNTPPQDLARAAGDQQIQSYRDNTNNLTTYQGHIPYDIACTVPQGFGNTAQFEQHDQTFSTSPDARFSPTTGEERVNCTYCSREFAKSYIHTHIQDMHSSEQYVQCTHDRCGWVFPQKKRWTTHHKTHHPGQSNKPCTGSCFESILRRDGYQCLGCQQIFNGPRKKDDINRHLPNCAARLTDRPA